MDFGHRGDYFFGRGGISHPPAGHGKCFGESAQKDGMFFHFGQRGKTGKLRAVNQFAVNFIGDYREIIFERQSGNIGQFPAAHHGAGRIGRIADENGPGFTGNLFFDIFGADFKVINFIGGNVHRFAPGESNTAAVSHKTRVGNDDLISGVNNRAHGQVECFTAADGN